jgi:hypothetical protein
MPMTGSDFPSVTASYASASDPFVALSDDLGTECSRYDPPSTFPSSDKKPNLGSPVSEGGASP